jgi:endonuclease/exonuclease/phosphatase family metal-dependent hydrolase
MRRTCRLVLTLALAVVPLSLPASAQAAGHSSVTVMTRNLYLGSDLGPALAAPSVPAFLGAVAQIWGNVQATAFPVRAGALADEIAAAHPDLVGLEEVSNWTVLGPSPTPSTDFLALLQARLADRGLNYVVAAVSDNADIGPVPLVGPFCSSSGLGDCLLRFQDRDVILVNADRQGLTVSGARHGTYATQQLVATPVGPLSFARGWASVQATVDGRSFRFAVTHLETEDAPAVQEAQGREFRDVVQAPGAVLAVGDLNSAADGSNTTTYADLTAGYFRDAAAGIGDTCCQDGSLAVATSQLHERIDLVLAHGPLQPVSATRTGVTPFEGTAPYWASDHAGVVATLRLP